MLKFDKNFVSTSNKIIFVDETIQIIKLKKYFFRYLIIYFQIVFFYRVDNDAIQFVNNSINIHAKFVNDNKIKKFRFRVVILREIRDSYYIHESKQLSILNEIVQKNALKINKFRKSLFGKYILLFEE